VSVAVSVSPTRARRRSQVIVIVAPRTAIHGPTQPITSVATIPPKSGSTRGDTSTNASPAMAAAPTREVAGWRRARSIVAGGMADHAGAPVRASRRRSEKTAGCRSIRALFGLETSAKPFA